MICIFILIAFCLHFCILDKVTWSENHKLSALACLFSCWIFDVLLAQVIVDSQLIASLVGVGTEICAESLVIN